MKHDSAHKLDVACLDCIKVHLEHNRKLRNFVRKVRDGFCLNQTHDDALKMLVGYENEAEEILNEIEKDNE